MSATAEITDKNDSDNIADFIRACNDARKAGRDLKSLLYGCYHRIDVTWAKRLLQRNKERQEKYEHLQSSW